MPARASCALGESPGAVMIVLAAKVMSPVSLALKRTSNGVTTANASRCSRLSAAPTTGTRRRRRSRVARRFRGPRPLTRVRPAAGSTSASGARASGAVRRRKGARKSRARRLMARCSRDWCELAWLENSQPENEKAGANDRPKAFTRAGSRVAEPPGRSRAVPSTRFPVVWLSCLDERASPRPRGRLRFTRQPIRMHGLRGEATHLGHFVTPGNRIRCKPRLRLRWFPCQTFR